MPKVSPMVRSFNGGVFSALMEGRTDLDRYPASCRILHNMIAAPQGPAICRSGTQLMSPVAEHDKRSFLVPFVFSNDQAQTLEFANDRIRFLSEAGIQVYTPVAFTLSTQSPFVITSATLGANLDDDVVLTGFPDDYNLNGEIARVLAKSGDDYTLSLTWPVGKANHNGTVARVYHLAFDYTEAEREKLRIVQSVDVLYCLTGSQPRKLLRYGTYDWRLQKIQFEDGPYLPINETTTKLTPSITGNAIPNMTDATTPSGTASATFTRPFIDGDPDGNYYLGRDITWDLPETFPWHAFNNDDNLYWSGGDPTDPALEKIQKGRLIYDFGAVAEIDGYSILAARDNNDTTYLVKDFAPSKFTLEGSLDGSTWVIVDEQEDYVLYDNDKSRFFDLKQSVSYRYYALDIKKLTRNGPIDARVRQLILRAKGRGAPINVSTGTTIHNATARQSAAFDTVFSQHHDNALFKDNVVNNSVYVGKTPASPRAVAYVKISGSNSRGYLHDGGVGNRQLVATLYGKAGGAPANGTDGTALGSITFDNGGGSEQNPRFIYSNNTTTYYDHYWVNITSVRNEDMYIAEAQFFGWQATTVMSISASSVVGINRDQGFLQGDVGRLIRVKGSDNYWRSVRIESVVSTTEVNVTLEGEPLPNTKPIKQWRLGAWGDSVGWPTCGDFFEDRLALAGSVEFPDLFALSMTGHYETFSQTDEYGVVLDESALVARLNARKLSGIKWLVGDEKGLLIGTGAGEYVLPVPPNGQALTARSIKAVNSTSRGSAEVEPVKVDRQVLYVQRAGRTLREMAYVYEADGYKSPSMSQLASHLGIKRFKELDYAAEPHSLVWVRREDGSLVGLTYNRDENVVGWHTHDFSGTVESMTVTPSQDQVQDALWMIVNRTINGQTRRYIEMLTRFWDFDMVLADAHYLDCALRYTGAPTTDIYGLQHLEGKEVYALADQKPQGPFTVVDGHIELGFAASDVLVGLGFDSEGETSRLENGAADGTAIGKTGRVHSASALLWDSYGGDVGVWTMTDTNGDGEGDKEYTPFSYPARTDMSHEVKLYTGETNVYPLPSMDKKCTIGFKRPKNSPLPFNVVALLPQMSKEDR